MRSRTVRIVLAAFVLIIGGLAAWLFWVPYGDPGGRVIASGRVWPTTPLIWSPDGHYLEYCADVKRGVGATYVARSDGTGARCLGQYLYPAGWRARPVRPVVMQVYGALPDREMSLLAVEPATGNIRALGPRFYLSGECSVAPSLRKAAVVRSHNPGGELLLAFPGGEVRKLRDFARPEFCREVAWSPDERTVAVLTSDGMKIVDAATVSCRTVMRFPPRVPGSGGTLTGAMAWSPDGKEIAFVASGLGAPARLLDWGASVFWRCSGTKTRWLQKPGSLLHQSQFRHVRCVAYSVGLRDGKVRELLRLPKGNDISLLAWSPDGRKLAAACYRGREAYGPTTIRVFDIPKAKPGDWRPIEDVLPGFRSGD